MAQHSGDPVAAISEAGATGEIAALYGDIRATLGVPVVNLIWRHLATFPGALPWAWQSLRPLYANGAIIAQAAALRAGLEVPSLPGLSAPVLAAAGLSQDDLTRIVMIQQSYERSNAMNLIALGALLAQLEGRVDDGGEVTAAISPPTEDAPRAAIGGKMPALLTLDQMSPDLAALVQDLNRISGRDDILASMYRHLSHWPAYLALVHCLIAPFAADGHLEPLILAVVKEGRHRAAQLAPGLATPGLALAGAVQAPVRAALIQFIDEPIGKMITIVPLIRRALPS